MATLTIEVPEGILSALRQSPSEAERDVRLAAAIDWFRRGLVSQGKAAEIAGLPRADFIDERPLLRVLSTVPARLAWIPVIKSDTISVEFS